MTFRSRPLLDLARDLPCTLRLPGCTNRNCVPAHSNWQSEGKGRGIKAEDCFFAAACPECHYLIDDEKRMGRAARRDAWVKGFLETVRLLWERGLVAVVGESKKQETKFAPLPKIVPRRGSWY